jgi:predicted ester cyclase
MSNLAIAKKVADLLESRDMKGLQVYLAEDFRAKGGTSELSKQQTLGFLQILFTAFPNHRFGFADLEEEGDLIHCTGHETGTHQGVLDLNPLGMPLSLPATGKSFKLPESVFTFRAENDKLIYFGEESAEGGGLAGILAQLGVKSP